MSALNLLLAEGRITRDDVVKGIFKTGETLNSVIYKDPTGVKKFEWWFKDGVLHRDGDLPADVFYCKIKNDWLIVKTWYLYGKITRANGLPTEVTYFRNTMTERWHVNGKTHRADDLPAVIEYNLTNNVKTYVAWYLNGKLNRLDGLPNTIFYNIDGNVEGYQYNTDKGGPLQTPI